MIAITGGHDRGDRKCRGGVPGREAAALERGLAPIEERIVEASHRDIAGLVRDLTRGIYQPVSHFGPADIDAYNHGFTRIIPLGRKITIPAVPRYRDGVRGVTLEP